jgi:hypothetical protein
MIAKRLLNPERRVPLEELAGTWSAATIEATVAGHGALADDLALMNRIRGALGRVLMQGASRDAIAGKPCSWRPPCALDVLFREQARLGKHGIPKPWVLALDRRGFDLIVRITLVGFALEWAGAVAQALAAALQHNIDWKGHGTAHEVFLPKPHIDRLEVQGLNGVMLPRPRTSATLDFVTPLDAAGDDPLDRSATVIGRLARRLDLLARWMDIQIDADWEKLSQVWNDLDFDAASLSRRAPLDRQSGRERHKFKVELVQGSLGIAGNLEPIWPIIALGQMCHVGRKATAGLGRYALS